MSLVWRSPLGAMLKPGYAINSGGDNASQLQSPELEKVPEPEDNISSDAKLKVDQSNQEMHLHPDVNLCAVPKSHSYGLGLMQASTSHLTQFDGSEAWANDVSRLANFSGENSPVPSSTSMTPLQRPITQPHQQFTFSVSCFCLITSLISSTFLYASIFEHDRARSANINRQSIHASWSSCTWGGGVKFPLPQFKPGTNAGNPVHFTFPSGYGPWTPPPVGYNLSVPSVTSGSSSGKEDLTASQLKENHIYTTVPLNESSAIWMAAAGQDIYNLPVNPLYKVSLHGPQLPFSPARARHGAITGLYQSSQTMAPSNVNTLLQHSQAMAAAAAETAVTASGANQQPQLAQINWNTNF